MLEKRGNVYHAVVRMQGRRVSRSTRTGDEREARRFEVALKRSLREASETDRRRVLDAVSLRRSASKIEEILSEYARAAALRGLVESTIQANTAALLRVLDASGLGPESSAAELRGAVLTRYAERALAGVGPSDDASRRRSVQSAATKARSIFSRWAIDAYKEAGLELPDLSEFLRRTPCTAPRKRWVYPDAGLVARTVEAGRALADTCPDMYCIFSLAFDVGLRAGEIAGCRRGWIEPVGDRYALRVCTRPEEGFRPKKDSEGTIPVSRTVGAALVRALGDRVFFVVGASKTARYDRVTRDFSAWMRGLGWSGPSTVHELRKLAGAAWFTKYGVAVAQRWLRHRSAAVTCQYYADLAEAPEPLDI
jgi:integrase